METCLRCECYWFYDTIFYPPKKTRHSESEVKFTTKSPTFACQNGRQKWAGYRSSLYKTNSKIKFHGQDSKDVRIVVTEIMVFRIIAINVYRQSRMIDQYVKEFKNNYNVCNSELLHHSKSKMMFTWNTNITFIIMTSKYCRINWYNTTIGCIKIYNLIYST